jgi:hypothetical protein
MLQKRGEIDRPILAQFENSVLEFRASAQETSITLLVFAPQLTDCRNHLRECRTAFLVGDE